MPKFLAFLLVLLRLTIFEMICLIDQWYIGIQRCSMLRTIQTCTVHWDLHVFHSQKHHVVCMTTKGIVKFPYSFCNIESTYLARA